MRATRARRRPRGSLGLCAETSECRRAAAPGGEAAPCPAPLAALRAPDPPRNLLLKRGSSSALGAPIRAGPARARARALPHSARVPAGALYLPRARPRRQSAGHEERERRRRALAAPRGRRRPGRTKARAGGSRRGPAPGPGPRTPDLDPGPAPGRRSRRRGGRRRPAAPGGRGRCTGRAGTPAPWARRGGSAGGSGRRAAGPEASGSRAAAMIIPVRCFTCGKIVGNKWEAYLGLLQAEYTEG